MKRVNASDSHGDDRAIAGDSDTCELPSDYRILATLDLGIGCGAAEAISVRDIDELHAESQRLSSA